jgi:hypothetical protein
MNRHLTSEQIAQALIGEGTADQQQHVRECPECQAELAQTRSTFSLFRDSVHDSSLRQGGAAVRRIQWDQPRAFFNQRLGLMLAATAMILMAVVPVYRNAGERQRKLQMERDAVLLEQVQTELSRTVPAPMEPLLNLVSQSYENPKQGAAQ